MTELAYRPRPPLCPIFPLPDVRLNTNDNPRSAQQAIHLSVPLFLTCTAEQLHACYIRLAHPPFPASPEVGACAPARRRLEEEGVGIRVDPAAEGEEEIADEIGVLKSA